MLAILGKLLSFPLIVVRYFRKRLPMKLCNIANYVAYFEERLAKLLRYLFSEFQLNQNQGSMTNVSLRKLRIFQNSYSLEVPTYVTICQFFLHSLPLPTFIHEKVTKYGRNKRRFFCVYSCLKGRIHCEIFLSEHFMKYIFRVIS